jgi:FdhE protein
MTAAATALDGLKRQRPEWGPWLAVVEEILREAETTRWDAAVPRDLQARPASVPLLAGATLSLQPRAVHRVLERVIRLASRGGTRKLERLEAVLGTEQDAVKLFTASLRQDRDWVKQFAADANVDAEALEAVVALVPVPFLQACNRRRTASVPGWAEAYCPMCGSWPAFAEVRGIERSRYFRCGRCGGEWHAHGLSCPFCATTDHNELAALVPENGGPGAVIEACTRCLGYVKAFTRLQGCAPGSVMLEDLASVDLDVAALEEGYTRPTGAGYAFDITVNPLRPFFSWRG